ncbi:hypothetical protein EV183_004181 [Coemansia sp. RSA 2336]|nr:hypothetical protein EV183_004181 [Coemansia sp. RSA 2336]
MAASATLRLPKLRMLSQQGFCSRLGQVYRSSHGRAAQADPTATLALVAVKPLPDSTTKRGRGTKWTEEEEAALDELGNSYLQTGALPQPKAYAEFGLKYGRSVAAVKGKFRNKYVERELSTPSRTKQRLWSAKEDDLLATAVMIYGAWGWKRVAEFVGSRTWLQCYRRYRLLNTPTLGKTMPHNRWTRIYKPNLFSYAYPNAQGKTWIRKPSILKDLVKKHKALPVVVPSEAAGSPQSKRPMGNRELMVPFDEEEKEIMYRLYRLYGHRWTLIAHMLNLYHQQRAADAGEDVAKLKPRSGDSVHEHFRQALGSMKKAQTRKPRALAKTAKQPGDSKRQHHRWTAEEDQRLKDAVNKALQDTDQPFVWKDVAREMGGAFKAHQCRARWLDFVGTHIKHTPYTEKEDRLLWPFVVASFEKASESYYYSCIETTISQRQPSGDVVDISLGWMVSRQLPHRSRLDVRRRIVRMKMCAMWLHRMVKVERPLDHFDLVRKLADSPVPLRHKIKAG